MLIGSSNLKHIVRFLLWGIEKYEAKIEKEGLEFLILKINKAINFDINKIDIPFIWNLDNNNFTNLIKEDIEYLMLLKIREKYNWMKLLGIMGPKHNKGNFKKFRNW